MRIHAAFGAIFLFLCGVILVTTRDNMRLEQKLDRAQIALETAIAAHDAAYEAGARAQEEKRHLEAKQSGKLVKLEEALENACNLDGICVPPDILAILRQQ